MGLSVGGIYVRTSDHASVVAAIQKHWRRVGARPLAGDPLALEPLSVAKTGKLGYCVFPPQADEAATPWVAVYDSERYHGSGELAEFLAAELDALVVLYGFTSSVDAAYLSTYRGASAQPAWREDSEDWGEVEDAISTLPFAMTYFNQLGGAELGGAAVFGFEGMPYREHGYRGPSEDERAAMGRLDAVRAAIAAGDAAAVRAIYDAHERDRYEILTAICDGVKRGFSDEVLNDAAAHANGERVVRAFAEELLADPSLYWRVLEVARVAFDTGDQALFRRATAIAGRHASGLASFAHELITQRRFAEAIDVAREVLAYESAPLTLFNNVAHALSQVPEMPPDAAELLARCDAHGMANSYIFHNTACAWVRLGDHERALAAVRGAVKAGYPLLDRLRADTDLAPLFGDPRFAAAFGAPEPLSFADLVVEKQYKGVTHVVQRPVLRFDFFLEPRGSQLVGPPLAALAEAYLADIPAGALTHVRRNGPWKKLAKAALTKDLNRFRAATDKDFLKLHLRGETDEGGGAPTEYGIEIEAWGDNDEIGPHSQVPTVSLWFPAAHAHGDVDAIAERFARYAALVPVEAGGAGLHVLRRTSDYVETWWDRELLDQAAGRFLGHEDHPWRDSSAGTAAGAQWLSFVGPALLARLGGLATVRDKVTGAVVREVRAGDALHGVVIRASLRPGLGVPPAPTDLGLLPKVARLLGEAMLEAETARNDPRAHYRRLFELPEQAYDNGPPVVPDPALRATPVAKPPAARRSAKKKP